MYDPILARVGAAPFETDEKGSFLAPGKALAELFLGPGAEPEALTSRVATEFYVLEELRRMFIASVRAADGRPVTDYVLLNLPGGATWCRLRAVVRRTPSGERFSGLVVRLEPDEDWLPGELLARIGWAYLRVDQEGKILYASRHALKQIGLREPEKLIRRPWAETHWARAEDCAQFLQEAWQHAESTDLVEFVRMGQPFRVELHAHVRGASVLETGNLEVFWREEPDAVVEQEARSAALALRERHVGRLDTFEHAIVDAVAARYRLHAAALYRYHGPARRYILRAERGVPTDTTIPREVKLDLEHDASTRPAAPFAPTGRWSGVLDDPEEILFPIQSASRDPHRLSLGPSLAWRRSGRRTVDQGFRRVPRHRGAGRRERGIETRLVDRPGACGRDSARRRSFHVLFEVPQPPARGDVSHGREYLRPPEARRGTPVVPRRHDGHRGHHWP